MVRESQLAPRTRAEQEERHDFEFDQGVQESLQRIMELYEGADHDLLIIINGSSINVGKSKLEAQLRQKLTQAQIYTDTVTDDLRVNVEAGMGPSAADIEALGYRPRRVYFLIRQGLSLRSTQQYRDFLHNNPEFVVPDLIIAIYRPDKPFQEEKGLVPVGDIVIRNERATNKPL